jgi:hypothetical protein
MTRTLRTVALAVPFAVLLAGCGSQEATQGSVRDDVKEALLERSDLDLTEEQAGEAADCVSRGMFESDGFSKDERNDATSSPDGDEPNPALVAKLVALFEECEIDVTPEPS